MSTIGVEREKVLYETKRASKRAITIILCGVFCIVFSVGCFALRGAKHEQTTIKTGYVGSDGVVHWIEEKSGYVNGNVYMLNEDGRELMSVMGCVFLLIGGFLLDTGMGVKRCWIKIYETYIEGQSFSLSFRKKKFRFPYERLESVLLGNGAVVIKAGGTFTVMCHDAESTFKELTRCQARN